MDKQPSSKYAAFMTFLIFTLIVLMLAAPFIGISLGLAVRFFVWAAQL